jgi:predicted 3-demethylubiquinone-9 3-methyltransferase (glyoxalase superfamily)
MKSQKIVPYLWFYKESVEAAEFYISIFKDSGITHKSKICDTSS